MYMVRLLVQSVDSKNNKLFYCKKFKMMKPVERFDIVLTKRLCQGCFLEKHKTVQCGRESVRSVPNCGKNIPDLFMYIQIPPM